jgi:UDP-glucose 4-epimerase
MYASLGKNDNLKVFGDDYPTKDGTCIRDYIHVNDLADAHIKAIEYLAKGNTSETVNLGTGVGYSVYEIIEKAKEITKKDIKYKVVGKRPGDPAVLVADNRKAKKIFNWSPKYDLEVILRTAYNWHKNQKY